MDNNNTSTNTPETTTTTTTTPDTNTVSTSENTADMNLQSIMEMDFSSDPKLSEVMSTEHKGLPDYKTLLMKHTTSEGRKLIANMRADYTRKTQELAEARKQLENEREAVRREKETYLHGDSARRIAESANQSVENIDPYTPEGLAKLVEIETAKRLQEMLKPQQEQLAQQKALAEAERFVNSRPEIRTEAFKAKLIPLMTTRPDLDLETAYLIVKGQLAEEAVAVEQTQKQAAAAQKKDQRAQMVKSVGTTNPGEVRPPKGLSPYEAMRWIQSNKK